MEVYYGIYISCILVTYLLLRKRLPILHEPAGNVAFWSASLFGLLTPHIFDMSALPLASFVYIGLAIIAAFILKKSSSGVERKDESVEAVAEVAVTKEPEVIPRDDLEKEIVVKEATVTEIKAEQLIVAVNVDKSADKLPDKPIVIETESTSVEPVKPEAIETAGKNAEIAETLEITETSEIIETSAREQEIDIYQAFEQLLDRKVNHSYDEAIIIAEQLQKNEHLPKHIKQTVTIELAELYLEKPDYTKALDLLTAIDSFGELSTDVRTYVDEYIQKIKTTERILHKYNKQQLPWSNIPVLIRIEIEQALI